VINLSNEQIEVEYTFKNYVSTPTKMSLNEWEKWFGESEWQEVPQDEYQIDTETKKIIVKVAQNKIVKILSAWDGMYFVEDYESFEIANIKIRGKNGTIVYEGNQLYKQFEEKNYTNRFIIYK